MSEYDVYDNYRDEDFLRNAFFDYTETVFPGVDFRIWYSRGFWRKKYIPFSIIRDDKVISNVSVTEMNLLIDGQPVSGLQFGTVGTIPEYRNQGLSRYLMEYVLDKYLEQVDIMFLFANESVIDFYPKFGFSRSSESLFVARSNLPRPAYRARQLSVDSNADMALIQKMLQERLILTELFGASDYDFITLWHVLNIFPDRLFYLEEEDAIFIVSQGNEKLHIWDIIHRKPFDVAAAIPKVLRSNGIKSIHYYFTPDRLDIRHEIMEMPDDSLLYVRGKFPLEGRSFKFPVTAQT